MRRVLWRWRGLTLYSYPFLLYVGILCGFAAGVAAGALHGLDPNRLGIAILVLLIPALAGSRLLFVLEHLRRFRREPGRVWSRNEGGASLYGGLLLSAALSVPLLRLLGLSFGGFWDAASITMLVGMVFTKVGCLMNGCCAGRETDGLLAQSSPDVRGVWRRRIPAQLLEAGAAAVLLLLGALLWSHLHADGAFFLLAVGGYAAARWFLEGAREEVDRIRGLSVNRIISAGLLVCCCSAFAAQKLLH